MASGTFSTDFQEEFKQIKDFIVSSSLGYGFFSSSQVPSLFISENVPCLPKRSKNPALKRPGFEVFSMITERSWRKCSYKAVLKKVLDSREHT